MSKFNLNPYQTRQIQQIAKYWQVGSTIYPGHIKSRANLDISMTYKFLKELEERGFLEKRYELYCSECHRFKGKVLKTLTDDLDECSCDFCDHEFSVFTDTIMIFEIVRLEIN